MRMRETFMTGYLRSVCVGAGARPMVYFDAPAASGLFTRRTEAS
jgi:hypothetical protein